MNFSVITDNLDYLLVGAWPAGPVGGLALTLILSVLSAIVSAALGLVLGIALAMSRGAAKTLLALFIGFFRAIPVIMLIFWSYFLLPIALGISAPEIGTVVVALSLISGAYLSHAVAAGIASVGIGQWEAGHVLGLGRWRILGLIVLPQALRAMAPSFVNQWTALVKDTSLAYVIGVPELSFVAAQVNNRAMVYPTEIFLFVGAVYWCLCAGLDRLAGLLARQDRPVTPAARLAPAPRP